MTQMDQQIEARIRRRRSASVAELFGEVGIISLSAVSVIGLALLVWIGVFVPAFGLLICLTAAYVLRMIRRRHARIALQYVEQAVRQNFPLPAMLNAAAASESRGLSRQLLRLSGYLESGATLSEAAEAALPGLPRANVGLIDAAEQLGVLPTTLSRLVRRAKGLDESDPVGSIYLRWYPIVLTFSIASVWAVFVIFVAPKFRQIFHDFGLKIPAVSEITWGGAGAFSMPAMIICVIIAIIAAAFSFSELLRPSGHRPRLMAWFVDRVAWITPVWHRLVQNRDLADVCLAAASAIDIGQPADAALLSAAQACGNRVVQNQVIDWAANVVAGLSLSDAARQAHLPAIVPGMLATETGAQGTADALRFLGRYYDSRGSAMAALLRGAAIPIMTLCFAVIVSLLVLGIFMPLIELVNALPQQGRVR